MGDYSKVSEIVTKRNLENNPMKNIPSELNPAKRPEVKAKQSETRKKLFREGKITIWNKGLTKETNRSMRKISKAMKEIRLHQIIPRKDTKIEVAVQKALTKEGIIFEKHKSILGQPDIFIEPNICIFIDGCYWHSCEQCFDKNKFTGKQRGAIVRDQFVTQKLINDGYKVLRFWEHDIKKDIDYIIFKIRNEINVSQIRQSTNLILRDKKMKSR